MERERFLFETLPDGTSKFTAQRRNGTAWETVSTKVLGRSHTRLWYRLATLVLPKAIAFDIVQAPADARPITTGPVDL